MDTHLILNADYLDLLYEGRNKAYGGYELRKKYRSRALLAGLISVFIIGGLFASLMIRIKQAPAEKITPVVTIKHLPPLKPVDPKKPTPPPPAAALPPPLKPMKKYTEPVIKKNEEVNEENIAKPPELNEVAGPENIEGSSDPNGIEPNLNPVFGEGNGHPVDNIKTRLDSVYRTVKQMPKFNGDINAYLSRNIRYPQIARQEKISGRVVLQFVVDQQGNVGNVEILQDIGGGCGAEAVRVVKGMPKWTPGRQNGQPVKVYYVLPVLFKLNN